MKSKKPEKIGDILMQMGFNPNGSAATQAVFLKHLIQQAYGVEVSIPETLLFVESRNNNQNENVSSIFEKQKKNSTEETQLCFLLEDEKKAVNG